MTHYFNPVIDPLTPQITPILDPGFRPFSLLLKELRELNPPAPVWNLALEQTDGSVARHSFRVYPEGHHGIGLNFRIFERTVKFLLWARGGFRIYTDAPPAFVEMLRDHFLKTSRGQFDDLVIGHKIYDRGIEIVATTTLPPSKVMTATLGRNLDGFRIGFDLGGSDRKVAALANGKVVFSEEVVWDPIRQADPQYHFDGIMDSLNRAASYLPRVDAIGGSAAGVYVNKKVKVASLFRSVPQNLFESRVKDLFFEIQRAWGGIPFELVNDGEVTALAGSMALEANGVLGIAMGTSMAAGYVTPEGNITSWLNELAFSPIDLRAGAPLDEWSGDLGCGVQFFSQQAVGRLLEVAGINPLPEMRLPERLKLVQDLMGARDHRAEKIYRTLGIYLGYAIALYADFYAFNHLLVLGRVMTGEGGTLLLEETRRVLEVEFAEIASQIQFHVPDEKEKRHGQAIAAASLPSLVTA